MKQMKTFIMAIFLIAMAAVFNARAFQIEDPEHTTYSNTTVNMLIEHSTELDSIIYQLDANQPVLACVNCSEYANDLVLSEGTHTIKAWGQKNGTSYSDNVTFTVDLPNEVNDFSLVIISPVEGTDYFNSILLLVHSNRTLDKMRYKIDSDSYETACTNCSSFNKTFNLKAGEHTITVKGDLNGEVKTVSTTFTVSKNNTFSLQIIKPTSKTYDIGIIQYKVESNVTLDKITVAVGDFQNYCTNCSTLNGEINMSKGSYSLKATGKLGDIQKQSTVWFKVSNKSNDDDYNETVDNNGSRFGKGFEKLPQMLENGEITDSELAKIMKNNLLNPGILNRLIKSGKLGDDSIDALLKYQTFMPTGIWMKFKGFFGYHYSYSEDIYKYYGKNKNVTKKLVSQDDLPKGIAKKIQQDLSDDIDQKIEKGNGNGNGNDNSNSNKNDSQNNSKKPLTIGKEKPFNDSKFNWFGKTSPGQAKKNDGGFFGNGRGKKN